MGQLSAQKPRIPSSGLPSLKTFWPQKLAQVTMTTIQQLHLGSAKGSTVADECWLERSAGRREPLHEAYSLGTFQVAEKASSV